MANQAQVHVAVGPTVRTYTLTDTEIHQGEFGMIVKVTGKAPWGAMVTILPGTAPVTIEEISTDDGDHA